MGTLPEEAAGLQAFSSQHLLHLRYKVTGSYTHTIEFYKKRSSQDIG